MSSFIKIKSGEIKEGMKFSAPVFFDDGKNMFLAEGKAAKPYHIVALKRWAIPYLLTYGHLLADTDNSLLPDSQAVEDLEPVDDLEPLEAETKQEENISLHYSDKNIHIA
ncbi:MAG: phosphohydrolase [Treponema sp.]